MGYRWQSVVIFSSPEVLCLGEMERSPHSLGKAYWIPWGGNHHQFWPPSSGLHLAGMHLTYSWGSSKGGLGNTDQLGSSPLLSGDSVPDRSSHMYGSWTGGSPRSPTDWDQSTVSSELPVMKNSHPPPQAASDPPFLQSHLSHWTERGSDLLLLDKTSLPTWGPFQTRVHTCILKSDPSLGLHWAGWSSLSTACILQQSCLPSMTPTLPSASRVPLLLVCHLLPEHWWLRECSWLWHCLCETEQWRHQYVPQTLLWWPTPNCGLPWHP